MPVEIDALQEWKVGDRMLDDMLRGMHPDDARSAGVAPRLAAAGTARLAQGHGHPRAGRRARHRGKSAPHAATRQAYDVDIDVGSGRRVTGTVRRCSATGLVAVTYSKLDGQAPAGVVDSPGGVDRSVSGPGVDGGVHRRGRSRPHPRAPARPAGDRRRPARPGRDVRRGPP